MDAFIDNIHYKFMSSQASKARLQSSNNRDGFYRAMHVVLARYCYHKSSVRPSVCNVVVPWAYRLDYSSKVIARISGVADCDPQNIWNPRKNC